MSRDRNFSPLFFLVAFLAVVTALYVAKEILLPICLAVLLSFLLTPLANRIEHFGLPRLPSVIAVVLIAFAALGMLGWIVTDQVNELRAELPTHRGKIIAKVQMFKRFSHRLQHMGDELTNGDAKTTGTANAPDAKEDAKEDDKSTPPIGEQADAKKVDEAASEATGTTLTLAQTFVAWLAAPLTAAGMVFVLVFFMLLDRENQRNRLIQLFGASNLHSTTEALHDATHRVGRYLRMQFLINCGYGVAVTIGLYFIGVPSALMWGVLGFSLRFLPYLGPWLAAVLPILVSLAVSDGWTQPIIVVCMYIVYELVLNNVAEPMLYGSSTGVSTVGVIISAIFWTWLWGPIGLILAMPMTVCLVVIARYVPQLKFITVMLADQPPLSPAERIYQRLLAFDDNEPRKFAQKYLASSSLAKYYDEVIIPALTLAERDRHAGLLNDEQDAFVLEAADDMVDELGETSAEEAADANNSAAAAAPQETTNDAGNRRGPPARVLCVPLRDQADEIAAKMLAQLLSADGFHVDSGTIDALASEVVDRVATSDVEIVVISVLPPIRSRESRLLWKRLRQRYPELPIIVGYWIGGAQESLLPPAGDAASRVATTLAQAVALVRSAAAQRKLAEAV